MERWTQGDSEMRFCAIRDRIPGNAATAQRARLLVAMLECGGVTTVDALRFLDIIDPAARIFELRSKGHGIATSFVSQVTECGVAHWVGRYCLIPPALLWRGEQLSLPLNA